MTSTMCLFSASGRSENLGPKPAKPGQQSQQSQQTLVRTSCTISRRPPGPLAPPPRRARLRSRCRSRYGGANAGRLARKTQNAGPLLTYSSCRAFNRRGVHSPAAELSKAGQNPSRPSVTAGQPHPPSCVVNAHAKTTLTEPARPRRWQRSEAWTQVARTASMARSPGTGSRTTAPQPPKLSGVNLWLCQ